MRGVLTGYLGCVTDPNAEQRSGLHKPSPLRYTGSQHVGWMRLLIY